MFVSKTAHPPVVLGRLQEFVDGAKARDIPETNIAGAQAEADHLAPPRFIDSKRKTCTVSATSTIDMKPNRLAAAWWVCDRLRS